MNIDSILSSNKRNHKHSLSQRTIVPKKSFKNVLIPQLTHNNSNRTLINASEAIFQTLKTCENHSLIKASSNGHTRVSSLDSNLENYLSGYKKEISTRQIIQNPFIGKVKTMINKLKNFQYIREKTKKKNSNKKYTKINDTKTQKFIMFPNIFVVGLIFKSWYAYVKTKRHL